MDLVKSKDMTLGSNSKDKDKSKMPSLIPISVSLRKRGFVHDPKAPFMTTPWVMPDNTQQALKLEAAKKFNQRVDRVIAVLTKFVAIASHKFLFNKYFKAGMAKHYKDLIIAEQRKAYVNRLVSMSDEEFYEYNGKVFAEHREYRQDIKPWLEFMYTIKAKRAEARRNVVQHKKVWKEVVFTTKPVAQRRVRNTGAFSALEDSDDE